SQTVSLLASQLRSKLDVPIQLHGEVELSGPSFQVALAPTDPRLSLKPKDREAVVALIKLVEHAKDLRLQLTFNVSSSESKETQRFVAEFRDLLLRSQLMTSQWSIQIKP